MTSDDDDVIVEEMAADAALFPLLARLADWGATRPDLYAGCWLTPSPDAPPTVGVGIVGDRSGWPDSLLELLAGESVTALEVPYSLRDLDEIAERVLTAGRTDLSSVAVIEPDNVVHIAVMSDHPERIEAQLRAELGTDAIRVRRERRARLMRREL